MLQESEPTTNGMSHRPSRERTQSRPGLSPRLIDNTRHPKEMKARKYNHLRATVKNLRRELRATREVINYQQRKIADLRKQLSELNATKESELDKVINRLHGIATAMNETAKQERERITAMTDGTPGI